MVNHKRFSIIKKDNIWYACTRTRISMDSVYLDRLYQGNTLGILWKNIKDKSNATRHYRRRNQWVIEYPSLG